MSLMDYDQFYQGETLNLKYRVTIFPIVVNLVFIFLGVVIVRSLHYSSKPASFVS
jgi:hypothetical protein